MSEIQHKHWMLSDVAEYYKSRLRAPEKFLNTLNPAARKTCSRKGERSSPTVCLDVPVNVSLIKIY